MILPHIKLSLTLLLLFAVCSQSDAGLIVAHDRAIGTCQITLADAQSLAAMAANERKQSPANVNAARSKLGGLCVDGDLEPGFNSSVGVVDQVFFAAKPVCVEHVAFMKGPNLPIAYPIRLLKVPI